MNPITETNNGLVPHEITFGASPTYEDLVMLLLEKNAPEDAFVRYFIGKIKVTSAWRAAGYEPTSSDWRQRMLQDLIRRAEDVDADAIIDLDFSVDDGTCQSDMGLQLERMCATGVAVRIANSALPAL